MCGRAGASVSYGDSVSGNEETEGFIIDWSQGVVAERPNGLPHYEVAFYAARPDKRLVYVVAYEYSPSIEQGYIYLPGKGRPVVSLQHSYDSPSAGGELVSCDERLG